MKKYTVKSAGGNIIYSGNDIEEALYQRDEFAYEYPDIGATLHQNY